MPFRDRIVLFVGDCLVAAIDRGATVAALEVEGLHAIWLDSQDVAARLLCELCPAVVVIDLGLARGSPLAVADFCNYRRPEARVILVGCGGLMKDGAIFGHVTNAAALVPGPMAATDMTALVAHHADRGAPVAAVGPASPRSVADLSGRRLPCSAGVVAAPLIA